MKYLKKYTLLLFALVFIILGAVLPYLTSQMQDAQISRLQKILELSTVNLTLRQEGDVRPVLQLMSKKHTEGSWEGETVLAKADACQAALAVLETMDQYGLLPEGSLKRFWKTVGYAEPQLLVGEDGSSALIWACTWEGIPGTYITLDDTTGKAVRILTENEPTDGGPVESTRFQTEKWAIFLQDYYDIDLETKFETTLVNENAAKGGLWILSNEIYFSSKDGTILNGLNLQITNDCVFFNYQ